MILLKHNATLKSICLKMMQSYATDPYICVCMRAYADCSAKNIFLQLFTLGSTEEQRKLRQGDGLSPLLQIIHRTSFMGTT